MKPELTLAYSPCPNDTFLFYHLVHQNLSNMFSIKEELHDVENLNIAAETGVYDITKLSFFAYFFVMNEYKLLNCGSALGKGCGPILVKKKGKKISPPEGQKILVPGLKTTANLLLNIYLQKNFEPIPIRYEMIIDKINREDFSYGVIIHEERFTFEERGLEKVVDLGEFWESETGKPIPLGAIAIKKGIETGLQKEFESALRKSLKLAHKNPQDAKEYILKNSQATSLDVVNSHIKLYVNKFTEEIGEEGREAVYFLLEKAAGIGLIKGSAKEIFLC